MLGLAPPPVAGQAAGRVGSSSATPTKNLLRKQEVFLFCFTFR
jgi:hypothetical protein